MRVLILIGYLLAGWTLTAAMPEPGADEKSFDLPAGVAEFTLKSFSAQSGLEVVFETKTVVKIRTRAVHGCYHPIRAVEQMLAGTPLVARQASPGGAIVISSAQKAKTAPTDATAKTAPESKPPS